MHLADDADILASQLHLDGHHARLLGNADTSVTTGEAVESENILKSLQMPNILLPYCAR